MKKFLRILKLIQKLNPYVIVSSLLLQITTLAKPYLTLFFSGSIVNMMLSKQSFNQILEVLVLFLIVYFVIAQLDGLFQRMSYVAKYDVSYKLDNALIKKALDMDYAALTNPETRLMFQRAEEGSVMSGGLVGFVATTLSFVFSIILSASVAGVALFHLLTTQTNVLDALGQFTNSWVYIACVVVLMVVPILVSLRANKKSANLQLQSFKTLTHGNREMSYYYSTVLQDNDSGKTIRIYDSIDLVYDVLKKGNEFILEEFGKMNAKTSRYNGLAQVVMVFSTTCLFLLIGMKAMVGVVTIGSILMYTGYLQTLLRELITGLGSVAYMQNMVNYMQYYIDFLELPPAPQGDQLIASAEHYEFKFEGVSFAYPGSEKLVLDDVTVSINDQERIAIVGQNGAGKTTFIKLLCRLYQPTSGRITLNGVDINSLNYHAYMKFMSVVFQDFKLYPFSIAENVAMTEAFETARVEEALKITGVYDKIGKLDDGIHTTLKGQMDHGVMLSGGEAQKVAIARAWYKDAPFVILDEPTAALDPLSEYEIYKNFDQLMDGKTAIYVSHRMSSCQFCDRVIVFAEGKVVESGHHRDLMNQTDSLYASLFNAQAQYYV